MADAIERPRLARRVPDILTKRLTIVAAPAGYGKTALLTDLAQNVCARGGELRWASPRVSGVRNVERTIRLHALETQTRAARQRHPRYLFIDDAELLQGQPALAQLHELLERGPASTRVVLSTRTRLNLDIARWRGRGELAELYGDSLGFDRDEIRRFLARLLGREPADAQLESIAERSCGWPTAIRLLAAPAGHDAVDDFLREEVLAPLAPAQCELLQLLAVSDRVCAPLAAVLSCDGGDGRDGAFLLKDVQSWCLFLRPLDPERRWFGLHPLLRDLLRHAFAERHPERSRALHLAAAGWFENAGLFPEALDQAMQAEDLDTAARIFDAHSEDFYAAGLEQSILPCANRLPVAVRARYPRILMAMSWRLQAELQLDRSRELLHTARERIEEMAANGDCAPADLRFFQNQLLHRLITQAQCEGDFDFVEKQANDLLRRYADASPYVRGSLHAAMLHARREQYELGQLVRLEALAREQLERVQSRYVLVFLEGIAAPGRLVRGQVDTLIEGLDRALALAIEISGERSALGAVVALLLAEAWLERNDTARTRVLLDAYLPNATQTGFEDQLIAGWLTDARLKCDAGDMAGALARLDEAISFASARGLHRLRMFAVSTAIEFHCRLGDRDAAASLATTIGLKRLAAPEVPQRITRAEAMRAMAWTRLAAARGHHTEAIGLARRWRARVSAAGAVRDRVRWDARIAMLQAATGDERAARRSIHQALIAGAPGRLIRPFVEEAESIAPLLPPALEPGAAENFQSRFADEVRAAVNAVTGNDTDARPETVDTPAPVDGLSQRELQILRLVGTGMLNGEVGSQLGLTEGSVKWYLQRIFDKVGTRRRMLAVEYARRRGLL